MSCQIAFVYGDQVAAFELDSKEYDKFNLEALRQKVAALIDLGAGIALTQVFFTYEDDDGDKVTIGHDADVSEAITVHEDAGVDHILLNVVVRKSGATLLSEGETDWSDKEDVTAEEKEQVKVGSFFSESFVLEVVQFMSDEAIKRLLPEMAAFVSFEVMKRSSSQAIVEALVAKYPILASTNLFKVHWPFLAAWAAKFDAWLNDLTEDRVAKVAFQIPIVTARLVAKRKRLYQHLFVKQRPMTKLLKMKQFDLGDVDFGFLLENTAKESENVSDATAHVGRSCSVCSVTPIEGVRYKCLVCADYDLCEACEAGGVHPADHAMMKFRTPAAGYVGIAVGHLDKKVHKHHLKAMKKEMKLSKKIAKMEKKHGKHRGKDSGCLLATTTASTFAPTEPPAYHNVGNAGDNDVLKVKKSSSEQKRPY